MELVRNYLEGSATLEQLIAKQKALQAELAKCKANERRLRSDAKKLLQYEHEARRIHDEAYREKEANAAKLNPLYYHYLDVRTRNDDIINGRAPNPQGLTDDELKAEIVAAGDPWREFKETVFEPSRDRYLQAKQDLDEAKVAEFNANEAADAEREQCVALEEKLDRLAIQIVLRRINCDGEKPEYMRSLASMLDISAYADDMHVKFDVTGVSNIYFGQRDYSEHGHIAIKPNGVERYRRMPDQPRGGQNFLVYRLGSRQNCRRATAQGMERMLQYA